MIKLQLDPVKFIKFDVVEEKEFKRLNIFNNKPHGFIIFDSYNNPFIPLHNIDLDDSKFSYLTIKQELKQKNWLGYFQPWHYLVEMVGTDYIAIQTRPINYKTQLLGYEEYLSICIVGNSKNDIYMKTIYKCITDIIMNSTHYIPSWKVNLQDETILINLGKSFDDHQLSKNFK